MIDNIVADYHLLSDYRLERWLLRYSQKSGDGSGGGGGGGGKNFCKTKFSRKHQTAPRPPIQLLLCHVTYPQGDKQRVSTSFHVLTNTCSFINAYGRCIFMLCCITAVFVGTSVTTAVSEVKQME